MRVDAYASEPHYHDHLKPVFDALPAEIKGEWRRHGTGPVLVASYKDHVSVGNRPTVLMEHGAGQTYSGRHPAYAGGRNRGRVALFLNPSERVARINAEANPGTPSIAIGCPKLDFWATCEKPATGIVGMAWHWDSIVAPEARTALPHYRGALAALAKRYEILGHAHPRIAGTAVKIYANAGIPFVEADELFRRAEILVVDNSSIGWEFIALDRPVVWCNAPWYRRDVEHGMRFWEYAETGVIVNEPDYLGSGILDALNDLGDEHTARHLVAPKIYGELDGRAAARGAAAIVSAFGG